MPPTYWMITDRNKQAGGLGADRAKLSFWVSDQPGLDQFNTVLMAAGVAPPPLAATVIG
jgi:hypothetical protein